MLIRIESPFNLESTLDSGQAFRWKNRSDYFEGVLDKSIILIKQITDGLEFESFPQSEKELKPQLKYYLSLHDDLEIILKSIAVDQNIQSYIDQYKGMRILKQDPWECLISFICSSNSNVLRVKQNVEDMSAAYGEKIEAFGSIRHTFPSPKQLENASIPILRQLKFGYRAEYIHEAVKLVSQHVINPWALLEEPYEEALMTLTKIPGIGDKVANCIMLFSMGKDDAFPVDVWIDRIIKELYPEELDDYIQRKYSNQLANKKRTKNRLKTPSVNRMIIKDWAREYFGDYAGWANHYMFHERRKRLLRS